MSVFHHIMLLHSLIKYLAKGIALLNHLQKFRVAIHWQQKRKCSHNKSEEQRGGNHWDFCTPAVGGKESRSQLVGWGKIPLTQLCNRALRE